MAGVSKAKRHQQAQAARARGAIGLKKSKQEMENEQKTIPTTSIPKVIIDENGKVISKIIITKAPAQVDGESGRDDDYYYCSDDSSSTGSFTRISYRCILCNTVVPEQGIPLDTPQPRSEVDTEDLLVMFVLREMLNVPGQKLENFLPTLGQPGNWISSCEPCRNLILKAFKAHRLIQKLETDLLKYKAHFKAKISSTWTKVENGDIVSRQSRCFVATQEWPEDDTEIVKFCPPDPSPPPPDPVQVVLKPPSLESVQVLYDPPVRKRRKVISAPAFAKSTVASSSAPQQLVIVIPPPLKAGPRKMRTYQCKMCPSLDAMELQSFVQHLLFHKRKPFKCSLCGNNLSGLPTEFSHIPKRNPAFGGHSETLTDHICSPETLEPVQFETHPVWECDFCPEEFSLEGARDSHAASCHPDQMPVKAAYSCDICQMKQFSNLNDWRIHRAIEHPGVSETSCFYCPKRFEIQTKAGPGFLDHVALGTHIREEHKSEREHYQESLAPWPECDFCGINFREEHDLKDHVENIHAIPIEVNKACPICFVRKFGQKCSYSLKLHVLTCHKLEKTVHVCETCGWSTKCRPAFKEHKLAMHDILPIRLDNLKKCPQEGCQFRTLIKKKYDMHQMKEHGAERPWKCSLCGKGFLQSHRLKDHEKIHSNKKPYQCEICGNSFALQNYLYIHKRLSHQNRPFASTNKKRSRQGKRKAAAVVNRSSMRVEGEAHDELPAEVGEKCEAVGNECEEKRDYVDL